MCCVFVGLHRLRLRVLLIAYIIAAIAICALCFVFV
jgi:hypothetical protein